jgi:hypothetical protein
MPLRNPHSKLWHWQQAIGWIAFDVVDPPPRFNIFNPDVTSQYPRREDRRLRINKAIDELLEAAKSAIKPIWLNNEPAIPLDADAARQMYNILDSKMWLTRGPLDALYFNRVAILQHWPKSTRTALTGEDHAGKKRGPPSLKRDKVVADMKSDIASGKTSLEQLKHEKEEFLAKQYGGVSRETVRNARDQVVSEIEKSGITTNSDN